MLKSTCPSTLVVFFAMVASPPIFAIGPSRANSGPAPQSITLVESETIRTYKNGALESAATLPAGSVLEVPTHISPQNYYLRLADGTTRWSSNFYFGGVKVLSVPSASSSPSAEQLNGLSSGLYVATFIASELFGDKIPAVVPQEAGAEFLQYFESSGKPKFNYTSYYQTRFGTQLNKVVPANQISTADKEKWSRVFKELVKLSNRTQESATQALFMNRKDAKLFGQRYVDTGEVQTRGAWSIAVQGTAVLFGFDDRPCAEFVSEMLRQAYLKAGYRHQDDFNENLKNPLIWYKKIGGVDHGSAAVINLSNYLNKAGWIPWESAIFKPVTGAPMMHAKATTPGHAYLVGGESGRIIVDNGSPYGKDLRSSPGKYIDMMYKHGVFFLPPGTTPEKW